MPEIPETRLTQISRKLEMMQAHLSAATSLYTEIKDLLEIKPRKKSQKRLESDALITRAIARRNAHIQRKIEKATTKNQSSPLK